MAGRPSINFPPGEVVLNVKLINPVNFGPAIIKRFMEPPVPGVEKKKPGPVLTFLLEHPSGLRLVFDLGIRKDYENYAPSIANYIPTTNYDIQVTDNVADILEKNGISKKSINGVIWSHWHWDHIGDPSSFPSTTDLIVGQGFSEAMLPGYPANQKSPIRESDYTGRNLREIRFNGPDALRIGQFPAVDYFGDGSFYLLDSPGHAIGHLCGLARTTANPPTFILMGGDICHYPGIFRPSEYLPLPKSISPHPFRQDQSLPFCPGSVFEELQSSRGRRPTDSLYDMCFGHDIPLAMKTRNHLQELDWHEDVFTIIAHDAAVRDGVDHFPQSLNAWKKKGWGRSLKWRWLRDLEPYWTSRGLN
ncbi:beta-lactamase-like protein [Talaromyces proteolyticus]|uniref:Beta-lactamase-like protein n=1 Tax=Talaromyces proteolyticus TaxID=1131652 RepID=A0AAD4PWW6_9EURO|nr:beta-lactamase-like protein [Talaromyces proteolyticus]KAH8695545.1 beta-lactamase-like protein [Talaromyces proteolyticus]